MKYFLSTLHFFAVLFFKKFRYLILFFAINLPTSAFADRTQQLSFAEKLKYLEKNFHGKIGVYAIDKNNNRILSYHADLRFPFQSTFKLMVIGSLLHNSMHNKQLLKEKIHYGNNAIIPWHPITGKYIKEGMTIEELSEAAVSYSDNVAINLIIKKLGGTKIVNQFARSIGNKSFNLVHNEPFLNSNINNQDDTVTPKDMALTVETLTLGNTISKPLRNTLITWMKNSTTSYKRMRATAPLTWTIADKTGSGNGVANDIGIMWSPACKPIVLAIYSAGKQTSGNSRDEIVATTTELILNEFAKTNSCFNAIM